MIQWRGTATWPTSVATERREMRRQLPAYDKPSQLVDGRDRSPNSRSREGRALFARSAVVSVVRELAASIGPRRQQDAGESSARPIRAMALLSPSSVARLSPSTHTIASPTLNAYPLSFPDLGHCSTRFSTSTPLRCYRVAPRMRRRASGVISSPHEGPPRRWIHYAPTQTSDGA